MVTEQATEQFHDFERDYDVSDGPDSLRNWYWRCQKCRVVWQTCSGGEPPGPSAIFPDSNVCKVTA